MKIATWNVNSIRSRVERVAAWTAREQPDVLCLQEIKTTEDTFPLAPFAELGYHAELFGQRTYNGVAILSREPLADVVRNLPDDPPDAPRRLIAATVAGVRVINVYVPNGQSPESEKFVYKLDWLARLRDFLQESASPSKPLLLLGDFNIAPGRRQARPLARQDPLPSQGARGALPPHLLGPVRPLPQTSPGRRVLLLVGLPAARLSAEQRPAHRPDPRHEAGPPALHRLRDPP